MPQTPIKPPANKPILSYNPKPTEASSVSSLKIDPGIEALFGMKTATIIAQNIGIFVFVAVIVGMFIIAVTTQGIIRVVGMFRSSQKVILVPYESSYLVSENRDP